MKKRLALAELIAVFLLIEMRIWIFHESYKTLAVLVPLIIVCLSAIRWDSLSTLGLRPKSISYGAADIGEQFAGMVSITALIGLFSSSSLSRNPDIIYLIPASFLKYLPWALFQQWCLNGYFTNRLNRISGNGQITPPLIGLLFAAVHLPNPVLTIAGFIGGWVSAYYFLKYRNLYPLAFCHALLGTVIKYLLPVAWHHNLKVGFGFINF